MKSRIYVGALCPGPVYTEFTKVARGKEWSSGMTPEKVVEYAVRKMQKGKKLIVPGFGIRAGLFGTRFLSRRRAARIVGWGQRSRIEEE